MTMLNNHHPDQINQLLMDADDLRERIEIEVERAIADVDQTSTDAEQCRAMLRQIRTTLPEVSLPLLMKVAALDATMKGAITSTISATLGVVGPAPWKLPLGSASEVLEMFTPMIASLQNQKLN